MFVVSLLSFSSLPLRPQPRNAGNCCDYVIYENVKNIAWYKSLLFWFLLCLYVSSRGDQEVNLNVLC